MTDNRYAIVKVNWKCPNKDNKEEIEDIFVCANRKDKREQNHNCSDCLYGDTKEQLVLKVAQVIFKAKLERYRQVWKCECSKMEKKGRYKDSLSLAKEIVEFLGVE